MRRIVFCTLGLATWSAQADADVHVAIRSGGDLPADLTADLEAGVLRQGEVEVPLIELFPGDPFHRYDPVAACGPRYGRASYDRATRRLVVDETACARTKLSIARASIIAHLARGAAWSAEARGDLAAARRELAAAIAADPGFERATLDLARVELRSGDRAGAAATLRPIIARSPVAHYIDYAANATFAPVLAEPPLSDLRTPTPGTARAALRSPLVARSARHDLLAIVREVPLGDGDFSSGDRDRRDVELVVLDLRGAIVGRLSLMPSGMSDAPWRYDDLRDLADAIALRLAAADRVLADLGFDPLPGAEVARFRRNDAGTYAATFPRAKLGIAVGSRDGTTARLLDHDRVIAERVIVKCGRAPASRFHCEYAPVFVWAAWLPGQRLALLSWHTAAAEHTDRVTMLELWQVPTP